MNLKKIKDQELLLKIKSLVSQEKNLLIEILHHLREIEVRKLFSELGYKSLFEYAVFELKYSESQAQRRISAMRVLKEIPEVEEKIQDGSLSLSNLSQAQTFFREQAKIEKVKSIPLEEKKEILSQLENKSARKAEKILVGLSPEIALPKEKERIVSETHTEIKYLQTQELKAKLEEIRTLMGLKGLNLSHAELINEMANLSLTALRAKAFGKKRTAEAFEDTAISKAEETKASKGKKKIKIVLKTDAIQKVSFVSQTNQETDFHKNSVSIKTDVGRVGLCEKDRNNSISTGSCNLQKSLSTPKVNDQLTGNKSKSKNKNQRYVSKALKFKIYQKHNNQCAKCGSKRNLNIDHIKPVALGGRSTEDNLQLLCFHCNQHRAMKTYPQMQVWF